MGGQMGGQMGGHHFGGCQVEKYVMGGQMGGHKIVRKNAIKISWLHQ